jgi:hypothetical protein
MNIRNLAFDSARVREAVAAGQTAEILRDLQRRAGISFDSALGKVGFLLNPANETEVLRDENGNYACDAQPELVTVNNAGIPAWLTNYFDPRIIQILVSPMRATEIVGSEEKKGDWTTTYATFMSVELTGEVSSYGDFNNNGMADANLNFPQRQSYLYQVFTNWGELQLARAGNARVDWANKVNEASILVLNKYQNATYFFGVAGLQNYGLLNDPSLPPSIVATAAWNAAATTGEVVYEDIRRLYVQAQLQSNGTIDVDTPCTLAMSPVLSVALNKTNQFNVNVWDQLQKNFPNLKVKTAVEYGTASGELVQLIFNQVQGQQTATTAFTEKMRAHAVVVGHSSWSQKKSQGTFGTVIFQPFAIASMIGAG